LIGSCVSYYFPKFISIYELFCCLMFSGLLIYSASLNQITLAPPIKSGTTTSISPSPSISPSSGLIVVPQPPRRNPVSNSFPFPSFSQTKSGIPKFVTYRSRWPSLLRSPLMNRAACVTGSCSPESLKLPVPSLYHTLVGFDISFAPLL